MGMRVNIMEQRGRVKQKDVPSSAHRGPYLAGTMYMTPGSGI
jgi:hypothetical protein